MGKHLERGLTLFELRRYHEAVVEFTRELEEEPQSPLAFANRAAALINLRKNCQAERDIRDVITIEPEYSFAYYLLSIVHSNRGRARAAEKDIREALRLEPSTLYFHRLAQLHFAVGRYSKCLDATQDALAFDPHHVPSLTLRAKALSSVGRVRDAQLLLRNALSISPENPQVHHSLGAQVLQKGESRQALSLLLEARRLDPIGHNDRDTIASAYGHILRPFRQIAPYVLRLELWSRRKRWMLWTLLGTGLILVRLLWHTDSSEPPIWILSVFIALANYFALPISLDLLTTTCGKLVCRKDLDVAWYEFFPEVLRPTFVILLHAVVTAIGVGCAYGPPGILVVALAIAMNFDLFLYVNRENSRFGRRVRLLLWICVVLTVALSAVFHEQKNATEIIILWGLVVVASLISTRVQI